MTVKDQENTPLRWQLSIDILLDVLGKIIVYVGLIFMVVAAVTADGFISGVLSILNGLYICAAGLVMRGLAAVIKELRRIRIALEDRHEGRP